jgi:hypothetical protein
LRVNAEPSPASTADGARRPGRPLARAALSTVVIGLGLLLAAAAVYVGWQLPHRLECGGGDSCHATVAIDWDRVDWGIPPERYACGVPHPGPENVLIGPGEVCVTAQSDGTVIEQVTYEQMRESATQRRILTLVVVALILAVTVVAVVAVAQRRRPATGA